MKPTTSIAEYILERLVELQKDFAFHRNPGVYSCGGIYIPRRQSLPPSFQVVNLANEDVPSKVCPCSSSLTSGLKEVLAKSSLN